MTLIANHMDHQVPQDNQPVENQLPINTPADSAPSAPVEQAAPQSESAPAPKAGKGIGKIDLAALASFSFGTQWTPADSPREARGDRPERGDRGPRQDRSRPHRPSRYWISTFFGSTWSKKDITIQWTVPVSQVMPPSPALYS